MQLIVIFAFVSLRAYTSVCSLMKADVGALQRRWKRSGRLSVLDGCLQTLVEFLGHFTYLLLAVCNTQKTFLFDKIR